MALMDYAKSELERAGMFAKDSDYAGMVGPAVMEMMRHFAAGGHSGCSANLCLSIFERLARYRPLTPIEDPMLNHEYVDHTETHGCPVFQATRLSTLFSEDGGKRWYDLDGRVSFWKKRLGVRRAYVSFPYMPQ